MKQTCLAVTLAIILLACTDLWAQTTAFNYQGSLQTSGTPANGNFDLQFLLFDALTNGSQLGTTISANNVVVTNGIFSVTLDFGSQFQGANRYLEIRIRPSGSQGITILAPRQQINSTPYAVKTLTADTATTAVNATNANSLGGIAAGQYVQTTDARMSDSRPPTAGSINYIQNGTALQAASFNVSGNGSIGLKLQVGPTAGNARVYADGGSSYMGVAGISSDTGVYGKGDVYGIYGFSTGQRGVSGQSSSGIGVEGRSATYTAVYGESSNGYGGVFRSTTGPGLYAHSEGGYALWSRSETNKALYVEGASHFTRWLELEELLTGGGTPLCRNASLQVSSCSSSSIRYKKNLGSFNYGLDVVRKLRPITFDWTSDGSHDIGLTAEEVERVAPLLAVYQKGQIDGVKYEKLPLVLINAIKEQQAGIEADKKQIASLSAQVEKQRAVNQKQEAEIEVLRILVCNKNRSAAICRKHAK